MSTPRVPIVLIVEDDESSRLMYSEYLASAGCSVVNACNGPEALQAARSHNPHVVVTDVSMPGMDGWALARALRENQITATARIIAVTGYMRDSAIDADARRSGVDVVLTKPCLPDELLREIRRLMARGRLGRVQPGRHLARANDLPARAARAARKPADLQRKRR